MRKITSFCIILISMCRISIGQDTLKCNPNRFNDDLFEKLVGHWNLTGNIGKRSVENNFSAEWVLNHQFLELNFADVVSPPGYLAKVLIGYDCISERYVIHWFDNFGGRFSETLGYGQKNGQTVEFRFEYPDAPFVNQFSYDSKNNNWHLHMTTKNEKGEWTVFGDEYLTRKK